MRVPMLNDAALDLVLNDGEEGRGARGQLSGHDEREVVRDVVLAVVLADCDDGR